MRVKTYVATPKSRQNVMSQHRETLQQLRPPPAVKVEANLRLAVPSTCRGAADCYRQPPRTAARPDTESRYISRLACVLDSCDTPRHAPNCKTSLSRPPATTRHRVSMSVRRAATRVRCTDVGYQPGLGRCEGTTAQKLCRHRLKALAGAVYLHFHLLEIHLKYVSKNPVCTCAPHP